jgi:hypothetical protein
MSPNVGTLNVLAAPSLYAWYTAPAVVTYQQTVTITATGPDNGGGPYTGRATVTLMPRISSSITAPTGLKATVVSNSEIDLSWAASAEARQPRQPA